MCFCLCVCEQVFEQFSKFGLCQSRKNARVSVTKLCRTPEGTANNWRGLKNWNKVKLFRFDTPKGMVHKISLNLNLTNLMQHAAFDFFFIHL